MGRPDDEGRRAFERGAASFRNPYEQDEYRRSHDPYFGDEHMDDYDRRRAERDWDDGYCSAKYQAEEREQEERRAAEHREMVERHEIEAQIEANAQWEEEQQQEEEEGEVGQ